MNLLDTLNINQRKAAEHIDGPCLVVAGAGSGKTKVLTTRIANLIDNGIYSSNILAITFTNKAAKEMKERLSNIIENNWAFVGTFHSFGVKIVRENYERLGMERNFTILDADDVTSVVKKIMKDLEIDPKEIAPAYVKSKISFIKNEMLTESGVDKYFNTYVEKKVVEIYRKYEATLKKNNAIDFDDLLKKPVELFIHNSDVLEAYQDKFKYILVDEYQDTNEVQYKLIKMLSAKNKNIFVVGDVNQSIYAFRGSNYKNIMNFEKDFSNCKVISLNQNYRSTTNILNAANCVIKNNSERKDVDLFSNLGEGAQIQYHRYFNDLSEAKGVVGEIKDLVSSGINRKDIAIFYRTNAQSRGIEEAMMKANIPYKVVGSFFFYKRKEIKDLLSYLKLISNNKDDISLERVINVPKRGIGPTSVNNLRSHAEEMNLSMFDAINSGKELKFKEIVLDIIKAKEDLSLTELIDYVLDKSGMISELEAEKTLEADIRIDNLMEFKSITENYQKETGNVNLEDFLEDISLVADINEHKDFDDVVTLMTIHASKGLEYKVVFLMGAEESILPHQNSLFDKAGLEEERRLCYVAITRAKEKLFISNAERRMLFGKTTANIPSRFIDEINDVYLNKKTEKQSSTIDIVKSNNLYSDANAEYSVGDNVYHSMFALGKVISVDDRFVTVAFSARFGTKKVLKTFKGLTKK